MAISRSISVTRCQTTSWAYNLFWASYLVNRLFVLLMQEKHIHRDVWCWSTCVAIKLQLLVCCSFFHEMNDAIPWLLAKHFRLHWFHCGRRLRNFCVIWIWNHQRYHLFLYWNIKKNDNPSKYVLKA